MKRFEYFLLILQAPQVTPMRTALILLALAAIALAQVCELDSTMTFSSGASQNIASCTYNNAFGQQRCLTGDQTKMLTIMNPDGSPGFWTASFSFQILGPSNEILTQPDGWGTRCVGGCTGIGINSCFNITSNAFTAQFQFNCLDAATCKVKFNFTMYTYCGDGVCDLNENCFKCPADCCPSASSSPTQSHSSSGSLAALPSPSRSATASRSPSRPGTASTSPSAPSAVAPSQIGGKNTQSSAATIAASAIIMAVAVAV